MNNLAPMKNCPGGGGGVQGNLNWMPGYMKCLLKSQKLSSKKYNIIRKFKPVTP